MNIVHLLLFVVFLALTTGSTVRGIEFFADDDDDENKRDEPAAGFEDEDSKSPVAGDQNDDGRSWEQYSNCKHIIVGAGWSGTYFAWRTTVNEPPIFKAKETCIFEATTRIGGRCYSKSGIPGMQDVRLDLGAYRFDQHAHPLLNRVFGKDVLALPTKCYDPEACNDQRTGKMVVAEDAYGNAWGYASGPEGLVNRFKAKGGRVFLDHRLGNIMESTNSEKPVLVQFENGVKLECLNLFLNMPKSAIKALDQSNILMTLGNEETKYALELPEESKGAKLFFVYPDASFRTVSGLSEGTFQDKVMDPIPLQGRLHDFQGKCPPSAHNSSDCWGAVLMYYNFAPAESKSDPISYLEQFQNNIADPFTYIPRGADCNDDKPNSALNKSDELICKLHRRFMAILSQRNDRFETANIALPTGMVISIWHARDRNSGLFPGVSNLEGGTRFHADPQHKIRNRVSKPLNHLNIFLANEAYSGGYGWAHPALVMTERIIYHHLSSQQTPHWVNSECMDYIMGTEPCTRCADCVSGHWWSQNIVIDPPEFDQKFDPMPNDPESDDECCTRGFENDDLHLVWQWLNETRLNISFFMKGTQFAGSAVGYAALGFGRGMSNADIIVAFPNNTVQQRRSFGHVEPQLVLPNDSFLKDSFVLVTPTGMNVTFTMSIDKSATAEVHSQSQISLSGGVNRIPILSLDNLTSVLYASRVDWPSSPNLTQHTIENVIQINFACDRPVKPIFNRDIMPLFRSKDREAMLFVFDLYNCSQVQANGEEIYRSIAAKTIHGLMTGMPPDVTWTLDKLKFFKRWLDSREDCSKNSCRYDEGTGLAPDFDLIKPLFRPVDRQVMISSFDLWRYEDVKAHGAKILNAVQSGRMPCEEHGGPWSSEKVQLFLDWYNCGMPPSKSAPDMVGGGSMSDREVFFKSINIDHFPEFRNESWKAVQRYLAESQEKQKQPPDDQWYWKPLDYYTPEDFESVLNKIYDGLVKDAAEYDPQHDPDYTTRDAVIERIRQMGPFNLVDGYWISSCCPVGSWSEVHAMLWGILTDEMGNGNLAQNHGMLYLDLMHSVGLFPPPVNSQAFAFDPTYLDSAFTQPAYSVTLALFSKALFPDLLGTTLQIEWSVLGSVPAIKLLKHWGINPHFYELHVGIDNAVKGHGFRAKRAVITYLDSLRVTEGEAAVQAAYKRIWTGFVAYDGLGSLTADLLSMLRTKRDPAMQVRELINTKASFGSMNHRQRHLGKDPINKLFSKPEKFMKALEKSAWVVLGYPEHSPLVNYLTQFQGPMYKVFDDADMILWRNWIASFKGYVKKSPSDEKLDVYDAVVHMIKRIAMVGIGAKRHNAVKIYGMSPNFPTMEIHQSVAKWLTIAEKHPNAVLAALKYPKNNLIVCGQPENSNIVRYTLKPGTEMGVMFSRVAAIAENLDDSPFHSSTVWTFTDILVRWIQANCPMASNTDATFKLFPCEHVPVQQIPKSTKQFRAYVH